MELVDDSPRRAFEGSSDQEIRDPLHFRAEISLRPLLQPLDLGFRLRELLRG